MNGSRQADVARVLECLDWMKANPVQGSHEWREGVLDEARALGLIPPAKPQVGCNCRPGIDRGIVYGADYLDAL